MQIPRKTTRPVSHPTDLTLALVPLTRGHFAVISAVDVDEVGHHRWHAFVGATTVYAIRHVRMSDGSQGAERLHTMIGRLMGMTADEIDHRNRNGLDCRRSNLRPATRAQNCHNRRKRADNVTGFVGVSLIRGRFMARVMQDGQSHYLGTFDTAAEAGRVAAELRARLHGEFATDGGAN